MLLVISCLCGGFVVAQDKPRDGMMTKKAMEAKKKMMATDLVTAAKKSMTSKESMVPGMVAREMVQLEMMQDKEAMGMIEKATMVKTSDDKLMMDDEKISMAGEKIMAEQTAMQMLFQELVARHVASKKMAMMKKTDPQIMTGAGKEMKSMMMDDGAMMGAKKDMMSSENSAMMLAREELIHSLMLDKEVMAMVEKESMMLEDPKMAQMMSDEKMKMEGEAIVKDKGKAKGIMQDTMLRKMIDGKQNMMKGDAKAKK